VHLLGGFTTYQRKFSIIRRKALKNPFKKRAFYRLVVCAAHGPGGVWCRGGPALRGGGLFRGRKIGYGRECYGGFWFCFCLLFFLCVVVGWSIILLNFKINKKKII
jgi:hypothetical protein